MTEHSTAARPVPAPPETSGSARDIYRGGNDYRFEIVEKFVQALGRPPRILHIGNIANNAYNNAKLLRGAGVDGDVICADYYHIMGCPEWEDADFTGEIGDHFAPDWTKVDLGDFQRPDWFVQGPLDLCLEYLRARNSGDMEQAAAIWGRLSVVNRTASAGQRIPFRTRVVLLWLRGQHYLVAMLSPESVRSKVRRLLVTRTVGQPASEGGIGAKGQLIVAACGWLSRLALIVSFLVLRAGSRLRRAAGANAAGNVTDPSRIQEVLADFRREFPERTDRMCLEDVARYWWKIGVWGDLFREYDLILGYGVDPIIPYLARVPYFAMEHGTLRDIPAQESGLGRLTALVYRHARHIFVTNSDCLPVARRLGADRVSFINHPFDEFHGEGRTGAAEFRARMQMELQAEYLIFFPTRHDWVEGRGFADKANDQLLGAVADLRSAGLRVGLVCCRWGANVWESQVLLEELGCAEFVRWEAPMGMVQFERMALACDVVADQFKLGSFGGIVFKALAVGAPVCTYLDEESVGRQFASVPPVINCRTRVEICEALRSTLMDRKHLGQLGAAGKAWMRREHSANETVRIQLASFEKEFAQRLRAKEPGGAR